MPGPVKPPIGGEGGVPAPPPEDRQTTSTVPVVVVTGPTTEYVEGGLPSAPDAGVVPALSGSPIARASSTTAIVARAEALLRDASHSRESDRWSHFLRSLDEMLQEESGDVYSHPLFESLLRIWEMSERRSERTQTTEISLDYFGEESLRALLIKIGKASPDLEERLALARWFLDHSDPSYSAQFDGQPDFPRDSAGYALRQLVPAFPESLREPFVEYAAGGDVHSGLITWNHDRKKPSGDRKFFDKTYDRILRNFQDIEASRKGDLSWSQEEHMLNHVIRPLYNIFHLLEKQEKLLFAGRLVEMFDYFEQSLERSLVFRTTGGHHETILALGEVVIPGLSDFPDQQLQYANLITGRLNHADPTTRWVAVNALSSALPALPRETPRAPYLDSIAKIAEHDSDPDVRVIAVRTLGENIPILAEAESQHRRRFQGVMRHLQRDSHWAVRGMANRYHHSHTTRTGGGGGRIAPLTMAIGAEMAAEEIVESAILGV